MLCTLPLEIANKSHRPCCAGAEKGSPKVLARQPESLRSSGFDAGQTGRAEPGHFINEPSPKCPSHAMTSAIWERDGVFHGRLERLAAYCIAQKMPVARTGQSSRAFEASMSLQRARVILPRGGVEDLAKPRKVLQP